MAVIFTVFTVAAIGSASANMIADESPTYSTYFTYLPEGYNYTTDCYSYSTNFGHQAMMFGGVNGSAYSVWFNVNGGILVSADVMKDSTSSTAVHKLYIENQDGSINITAISLGSSSITYTSQYGGVKGISLPNGIYRIHIVNQFQSPNSGATIWDDVRVVGNATYTVDPIPDPASVVFYGKYYEGSTGQPMVNHEVLVELQDLNNMMGYNYTDANGNYYISFTLDDDYLAEKMDIQFDTGTPVGYFQFSNITLSNMTYIGNTYYYGLNFNNATMYSGPEQIVVEMPSFPTGSLNILDYLWYIIQFLQYAYQTGITYLVGIYDNTLSGVGGTIGNLTNVTEPLVNVYDFLTNSTIPQIGSNVSIYDQIDANFALVNTSVNTSFHIVMGPAYNLRDALVAVNGTTAAARSMADNATSVYAETLLPMLIGLPVTFKVYGIWRLTLIIILQAVGK